jgi:hypothetical protein
MVGVQVLQINFPPFNGYAFLPTAPPKPAALKLPEAPRNAATNDQPREPDAPPPTRSLAQPQTDAKVATDLLASSAGYPICHDQDELARLFMAAVLVAGGKLQAEDVERGACDVIPPGARVEVLERYVSGTDIGRVVKVRVTSPRLVGPTIGYTFELGR